MVKTVNKQGNIEAEGFPEPRARLMKNHISVQKSERTGSFSCAASHSGLMTFRSSQSPRTLWIIFAMSEKRKPNLGRMTTRHWFQPLRVLTVIMIYVYAFCISSTNEANAKQTPVIFSYSREEDMDIEQLEVYLLKSFPIGTYL